jgi:hypothetical protein
LQPEGSSIPQLWFWSVFHLTTTPKCKNMENLPFVDCRPFLLWNFPNHCQVSPMSMQHSFFFLADFLCVLVVPKMAKGRCGRTSSITSTTSMTFYDMGSPGFTCVFPINVCSCLVMFG